MLFTSVIQCQTTTFSFLSVRQFGAIVTAAAILVPGAITTDACCHGGPL